nr:MAG TPA: Type III secretion system effector [Caudoviricetes sp.]
MTIPCNQYHNHNHNQYHNHIPETYSLREYI